MPQSKVIGRYEVSVAKAQLSPDDAQRRVAIRFGHVVAQLEKQGQRLGFFDRLARRKLVPVQGVYLWEGIGRGKSMLLDLFFNCVDVKEKRRVHFHEFMQEVHDRLRVERAKRAGEPCDLSDYIALVHRYHTLVLVGIPVFDANRKSEAARFKTLIDTLYENGGKLLAAAERDPDTLYWATEDAIEFERTVSRLNEMGPQDYFARGHGVLDKEVAASPRFRR